MVATIVGLHRMGQGALAAPPVGSLGAFRAWTGARDPVTVGLATGRVAALGLAYHLVATSVLAAVGRLVHRPAMVRVAMASTPRPLRGAVRRSVGVALSITAAATTVPAGGVPGRAAVVLAEQGHQPLGRADLVRLGSGTPVVLRRVGADGAGHGAATLRRVEPPGPQHRATVPPPPPAGERHVVRPGDHLWSIAEARLARALGRPVHDREIGAYWRAVVAANPQLIDPDLLHPGDSVVVPPVPGGRGTRPAPPLIPPGSATLEQLPPP